MAANMAIHGSHNANLAVEQDGKLVCVVEFERLFSLKNIGFTDFYPLTGVKDFIMREVADLIQTHFGISEYDNVWFEDTDHNCIKFLNAKNFHHVGEHHQYHAYGTFYQSNFPEALVVSYDGGATDGYFKIYKIKRGEKIEQLRCVGMDLGSHYGTVGSLMRDIKPSPFGSLVYAGKIMGLQSYGKVNAEWLPHVKEWYKPTPYWRDLDLRINDLMAKCNIELGPDRKLAGQVAYDLAATSQQAFEELTFEHIDDLVQQNPDLPICVTGGCGLNILMNTKIRERYGRPVFVAPNSNDCGLAMGILAAHVLPKETWDCTYAGLPALDRWLLSKYMHDFGGRPVSLEHIVEDLAADRILGVVQGRAEHGPRALGNRSIICNAAGDHMKDTLNAKVKNREWYRPFAPIVRLEDVSEYFELHEESRWMNFCPMVRPEWRTRIPSITHVDNTARVQTVTREQNSFMYDLLTKFKEKTGLGVLLNTSFNVDGKPILSSYAEAFEVYQKTQLDRLYLDGYYFSK